MAATPAPLFTWNRLFALIALIIFVLAAIHVRLGGLEMVPLGLAFLAAARLI